MIICAAIRFTFINKCNEEESIVICGRRHGDCFRIWDKIDPSLKQTKIQEVQGFIDNKGRFMDRIAARKHFVECKQGIPEYSDELYSEDLY